MWWYDDIFCIQSVPASLLKIKAGFCNTVYVSGYKRIHWIKMWIKFKTVLIYEKHVLWYKIRLIHNIGKLAVQCIDVWLKFYNKSGGVGNPVSCFKKSSKHPAVVIAGANHRKISNYLLLSRLESLGQINSSMIGV